MTRHEPDGGVCAVCCADWPCPDSAPTWTLRLPYTAPPLTGNDRMHWRKKAAVVATLRGTVAGLVLGDQGKPWPRYADHVEVWLHYWPRDKRRRDADNLVATLKVCCDALVDAGVVRDDTPAEMTKHMPVIHAPDGDPRLELTIRLGAS